MPIFNRYSTQPEFLGEGSGDGSIVSINAKPFFGPSAGTGGYFDEFRFISQYYNEHQHPIIILVDTRTGKYELLLDDGAPFVMAGGNKWSAFTMNNGVIVNGERTNEDISPIVYGSDGSLAYTDHSHVGLWILFDDKRVKITDEEVFDLTVLEHNQLVYLTRHGIELSLNGNKYPCVSLGELNEFGHVRAYWWKDNIWVAYQWYNANSIVTHPYDSYEGYVLGSGDCYGLDALVYDKPYYAWSVSPAAQAHHMVLVSELGNKIDLRTLLQPEPPNPEPPKPIPEPPDPIPPKPEPEPIIKTATVYEMNMEKQLVALIAFDGKYISVTSTGNIKYNNKDVTPECVFELTKPDGLFSIQQNGKWLGADATEHHDVCNQLYMIDHREGYESWIVERPAIPNNDLISAYILFRRPEGINFSIKLRVVEL